MSGPVLWPHAAFAHIERNNTELGRLWCMPQRLSCQCHQRLQSMFPMRNTSIHVWLDVFGIHGMSTIDFTLVFHWFGGQRTMVSFSSHVDVSINWLSSVMFVYVSASPKANWYCTLVHLQKWSFRLWSPFLCTNRCGRSEFIRAKWHDWPIGIRYSIIPRQIMSKNCIAHRKLSIHCESSPRSLYISFVSQPK